MKVKVVKEPGVILPKAESQFAAGLDIKANLFQPIDKFNIKFGCTFSVTNKTADALVDLITIHPGGRLLVPTGIKVAIPIGYEIEVRPRSGLAIKHGVTIVNTPGTIDCDYRGEIMIILANNGSEDFEIRNGDRIGQLCLRKTEHLEWDEVEKLPSTDRGEGGFGSTGN